MNYRKDDFETRSKHLQKMSDEELDDYFWELLDKIVDPLVSLAEKNTSPSIERSVLLRMGFSSIESKKLVDMIVGKNLLGKGAGNIVYKISKRHSLDIRNAGLALLNNEYWDEVESIFKGVKI